MCFLKMLNISSLQPPHVRDVYIAWWPLSTNNNPLEEKSSTFNHNYFSIVKEYDSVKIIIIISSG